MKKTVSRTQPRAQKKPTSAAKQRTTVKQHTKTITTKKAAARKKTTPGKKAPLKHTSPAALSKPIDVLCRQLDAGQRKLASLLAATLRKVEKSLQTNQIKLAKLTEQEKKQQATVKSCQTHYKNAPSKLTKTALHKAEQTQRALRAAREQTQTQQTTWLSELRYYQTLAKGRAPEKRTSTLAAAKPAANTKLATTNTAPVTNTAAKATSAKPAPAKPVSTKPTPAKTMPGKTATTSMKETHEQIEHAHTPNKKGPNDNNPINDHKTSNDNKTTNEPTAAVDDVPSEEANQPDTQCVS